MPDNNINSNNNNNNYNNNNDAISGQNSVSCNQETPNVKSTADVLVVDDNLICLKILSGIFGSLGVNIETAASGEEAIEKVKNKDYDVVFMDYVMPGINGIEAMQLIRELGKDEKILPVIAVTENTDLGDREMFMSYGANDFIAKPMRKPELNAILIRWLPREKYTLEKQEVKWEDLIKSNVPEINLQVGLLRTGENHDVFLKTLGMFYRILPEKSKKILEYLNENKIKEFIIEVHGTKGGLAGMGCDGLAQKAAELEHAAKDGDLEYCTKNTAAFINVLENFHKKLESIVAVLEENVSNETKKIANPDMFREQLSIIGGALEKFDSDAATKALEKLCTFTFPNEINDLIKKIKQHVDDFDYKNAKTTLEKLSEMKFV
ncbi:MAG: response regulator [Thermoguttaceae bacterium]